MLEEADLTEVGVVVAAFEVEVGEDLGGLAGDAGLGEGVLEESVLAWVRGEVPN